MIRINESQQNSIRISKNQRTSLEMMKTKWNQQESLKDAKIIANQLQTLEILHCNYYRRHAENIGHRGIDTPGGNFEPSLKHW